MPQVLILSSQILTGRGITDGVRVSCSSVEISYLTQQAPATTRAREPATMKTLLMTEKANRHTVRGRELCVDLYLQALEEDMIPD